MRPLAAGERPALCAAQPPTQPDTTRLIAGIRRHGVRSLQVVAFPSQPGPGKVYNLAGGIDAGSLGAAPQVARD